MQRLEISANSPFSHQRHPMLSGPHALLGQQIPPPPPGAMHASPNPLQLFTHSQVPAEISAHIGLPPAQALPHIPQLRGSSVHAGNPVSRAPVSTGTPVSTRTPVSTGGTPVSTGTPVSIGVIPLSVGAASIPVFPLSCGSAVSACASARPASGVASADCNGGAQRAVSSVAQSVRSKAFRGIAASLWQPASRRQHRPPRG